MMTKRQLMHAEFEDRILEIIDNAEDFTRSDLQGVVMALVMNLIREVEKGVRND